MYRFSSCCFASCSGADETGVDSGIIGDIVHEEVGIEGVCMGSCTSEIEESVCSGVILQNEKKSNSTG